MTATLPDSGTRSRIRGSRRPMAVDTARDDRLVAVLWPIVAGEQSADFARALLPPVMPRCSAPTTPATISA